VYRKATTLITIVVLMAGVGGAVWMRSRSVSPAPRNDAMPILGWALHACYGVNHVGEQITTVSAGDKEVTTRVNLAYLRPGLMRLQYLDGPLKGVKVWDDGHRIYRYRPDKNRMDVKPTAQCRPLDLEQQLALVRKNYTASLASETVVAGRKAQEVLLRSRHPGNPWKRLWIDEDTYLMLGSEDYDSHDHRLRATRFVKLALDTQPESVFHPDPALLQRVTPRVSGDSAADEAPQSAERLSRRVGFAILLPEYTPPGYRLLGSFAIPCECGRGDEAVRSKYSDGLNTISVFQCGHPCANGDQCWVANARHAVALQLPRGQDTFLFVGEVDRSMLEQMARSVPLRPNRVASGGLEKN
jgi:outer membrane lipoprotein-sorting protein